MSETEINVPSLMRKARIAVSRENFEEAAGYYETLLQHSDMNDQLDLKTRYAFCLEKKGDLHAAADVNQEIVEAYKSSGEVGAAKALELKISIIRKLADQSIDIEEVLAQEPEGEEIQADFSAMSLDTQDIIPLETEEPVADQVEEEQMASGDILFEAAEVEEAELEEDEEEYQFEDSLNEEPSEPEEVVVHEKKDDNAIHEISDLIKEGIKKNLASRPGEQVNIELMHLKGYNANNLELDGDYQKIDNDEMSQKEVETNQRLKLKASQIFGTKPK